MPEYSSYVITSNWLASAAFFGLTTTQAFSLGGNDRQGEFAMVYGGQFGVDVAFDPQPSSQ